MQKSSIMIRDATVADVPSIYDLVLELARFEHALHEVETTVEQLMADGFGENPLYGCIVAEDETKKIVGISLYYFRYSTWKGKRLFLEDLIVSEPFRRQGIGTQLFEATMQKAFTLGCNGMVWQVLDWNAPAISFYKKYGADLDHSWINVSLSATKINKSRAKYYN